MTVETETLARELATSTLTFPRYQAYRDSGVEWLGEIPAQWQASKAKWVFREISHKGYSDEQLLSATQSGGVVPRDDLESRVMMPMGELLMYKLVEPGDFVISLRSFQGGIEYSEHRGLVSPAYTVLRDIDDICKPYFRHLLKSGRFIQELNRSITGIRQGRNIDFQDFKETWVPLPPLAEQRAIAAYLDRETARIDALVSAKERLIALLQEKRAALISHAVTRGLDPAAPMKDSGVPWMEEIPAHWEVNRVKYLAQIVRGQFSHRPRNDERMFNGKYPFIQTGEVSSENKYVESYHQTLNEDGFAVSKLFPAGTLVMTIAANVADAGILTFDACFPDSLVGMMPNECVTTDYLYYLLRGMRDEFLKTAPINTQLNLNIERIGSLFAPLPPKDEQHAIVAYLDHETAKLDTLIARIRQHIEKVKEYRAAIISAAVTGKIDVRSQEPAHE